MQEWAGADGAIGLEIAEQNRKCLATYREDAARVTQDANIEAQIFEGGYAERQLFELVQNAADALHSTSGRVEVRLTESTLYVANEGSALTPAGVVSLMASHISKKEADEIGRFGLGFKSVLAVSARPQVYSRSGSVGFDADATRRRIEEVVPQLDRYPTTRLAEALDFSEAAAADPHLAELGAWATTVVKLPLRARQEELSKEMRLFPAEFLLFSPQISRVVIDDRTTHNHREISCRRQDDGTFRLDVGDKTTRWVVQQRKHKPSIEALTDGGFRAARPEVTIQWAAPVSGAVRIGSFWAYFPTADLTTLSGIVNAPWKLTEDRLTLLQGSFNEELLTEVLPKVVVSAVQALSPPDNPCAVIDAMPARGREDRSWADKVINIPVMSALAKAPSIPDLKGTLRPPADLDLHPDGVDQDVLGLWAASCPTPERWVHHGVYGDERRSKVTRLLASAGRDPVDVPRWLEALIGDDPVAGSIAALGVAARLIRSDLPDATTAVGRARIVLLEDGTMHTPRRGRIFVRGHEGDTGHLFIHPDLAASPDARAALAALGISVLDTAGELRHSLQENPPQWPRVWDVSRRLPLDVSESIFRETFGDTVLHAAHARTADGSTKPLSQVFLPGRVIPADAKRDRAFVVDSRSHHEDIELMTRLGAVSSPTRGGTRPKEPFMTSLEDEMRDKFRERYDPRTPDNQIVLSGPPMPWPLDLLPRLSDEGRAALTSAVLAMGPAEKWEVRSLRHKTKSDRWTNPTYVWLQRHGRLETPVGPMRPSHCIRPTDDLEGEPLPTAIEVSDLQLNELAVPETLDRIPESAWAEMLTRAADWPDAARRVRLYAWAGETGVQAPAAIVATAARGSVRVAPGSVAVTDEEDLFHDLVGADIPSLLCRTEDLPGLMDNWGLADGREMLQEEVQFEPAGEPRVLVDAYPPLALHTGSGEVTQRSMVQPCRSIVVLTSTPQGQTSKTTPARREGDTILVTATDERGMLQQALSVLKIAVDAASVLRSMATARDRKLRADIVKADGVARKLLLAIGPDELRRNLPRAALRALAQEAGRDLDDEAVARLSVAVHGYGVLQVHRQQLAERKLEPPTTWAGTTSARRWVTALGFPVEFAGFTGRSRPPVYEVEGPVRLPRLHDYQRVVADNIKGMLAPGGEATRGMVSLPTGAGKTRVAVEALVEHFAGRSDDEHLLWIAQSDELCEQAVQTWAYLWRAAGPADRMLSIGRLWGSNDVEERSNGLQVVVATIDKLKSCGGRQEYEWLADPALVVVDEAHSSITSSYTEVLARLGGTRRVAEMRTRLLGLTATPFRNTNIEETKRLIERYHNNRLDRGAFPEGTDPYSALQHEKVLAQVRQRVLEGARIQADPKELASLEKMRTIPSTVEQRLADDDVRNRTIVESIEGLDPSWPVLLFATSVESSRTLAAMLSHRGVPARAISGDTDMNARRRYVQDFKNGEIRVLTNYNVFTQGFDVPAVRAVYVTRPTYSANLYQQMIGRGLRGPLNGGSEEVLIVNVEDNLTNYGEALAFREFEYLWDGVRT